MLRSSAILHALLTLLLLPVGHAVPLHECHFSVPFSLPLWPRGRFRKTGSPVLRGGWFKRAHDEDEEGSSYTNGTYNADFEQPQPDVQSMASSVMDAFENDVEHVVARHRVELEDTCQQLRSYLSTSDRGGGGVAVMEEEEPEEEPQQVAVEEEPEQQHQPPLEEASEEEAVVAMDNSITADEDAPNDGVEVVEETQDTYVKVLSQDEHGDLENDHDSAVEPAAMVEQEDESENVIADARSTLKDALEMSRDKNFTVSSVMAVLSDHALTAAFMVASIYLLNRFVREVVVQVVVPQLGLAFAKMMGLLGKSAASVQPNHP